MLDVLKAMQELAGPMGQSMMDLRGMADQIATCCGQSRAVAFIFIAAIYRQFAAELRRSTGTVM